MHLPQWDLFSPVLVLAGWTQLCCSLLQSHSRSGVPSTCTHPPAWALPSTPTAHRRTGRAGMQLLPAGAFREGKRIKESKVALGSSQSHQVSDTLLERLLSEHPHTSLRIRHQCGLTQPGGLSLLHNKLPSYPTSGSQGKEGGQGIDSTFHPEYLWKHCWYSRSKNKLL